MPKVTKKRGQAKSTLTKNSKTNASSDADDQTIETVVNDTDQTQPKRGIKRKLSTISEKVEFHR